jgi:hypothetical protein
MVLVVAPTDHPVRDVTRRLLELDPEATVVTRVQDLLAQRPGRLVLLAPAPADAEWLNVHRALFAERRLRVVVWASPETAGLLARKAPDFFDWLSVRVDAPSGPPPILVDDLRAAQRWPGIEWSGDDLDACFAEAFPRARLVRFSADEAFEALVERLRAVRSSGWVAVADVRDVRDLYRVRIALAAAGRDRRMILDSPRVRSPGWWPVGEQTLSWHDATTLLSERAGTSAGLISAQAGLEGSTLLWCVIALQGGWDPSEVSARLRSEPPPWCQVTADLLVTLLMNEGRAPALWRVWGRNTDLPGAYATWRRRVRLALAKGERVTPACLAAWAPGVRPGAKVPELVGSEPASYAWYLEAFLRKASARTRRALSTAEISGLVESGANTLPHAWPIVVEQGRAGLDLFAHVFTRNESIGTDFAMYFLRGGNPALALEVVEAQRQSGSELAAVLAAALEIGDGASDAGLEALRAVTERVRDDELGVFARTLLALGEARAGRLDRAEAMAAALSSESSAARHWLLWSRLSAIATTRGDSECGRRARQIAIDGYRTYREQGGSAATDSLQLFRKCLLAMRDTTHGAGVLEVLNAIATAPETSTAKAALARALAAVVRRDVQTALAEMDRLTVPDAVELELLLTSLGFDPPANAPR